MLPSSSLPTLHSSSEIANEEDAMNCYTSQSYLENTQLSLSRIFFGDVHPFEDECILRHYENFRINSVSAIHSLIWVFLGLIYLTGCIVSFSACNTSGLFLMRFLIMARLTVIALALWNYYKIFLSRVPHNANKEDFHCFVKSVTNLSNVIVIALSVVNGVAYVWRSSLGSCLIFNPVLQNSEIMNETDEVCFNCNPSFEIGDTPGNALVILLVGNIFVVVSLCCHSSWAARVNYFVTCISCFAAAAVTPDPGRSTLVVLMTLILVIIFEGIENSALAVFKALLHLESTKRIQTTELKRFIGNVAHDLKTPLHGFSVCMDHLLLDAREHLSCVQDRDSMISTMELCKANCSFMTSAISRTVDFAKSASRIALSANMETTSVTEALQWAISCVNSTQTQFHIEEPPLPLNMCDFVVTDKHWLMENLLCYLSNAVKYSSDGKIAITISLQDCEREEGDGSSPMLCISVEDEGIGIEDSKKSSLFQPFQQTMRLAGGTGLGLYSLAKRVEVLRGEYGVTDRSDGRTGSRFWFTIPYVADEVYRDTNIRQESGIMRTASEDNGSINGIALIVDDSLVITKSTRRMLSKAGYAVDVAENGAVGLEKMKRQVYTIVVMDLQMPIMDGLEATRRIRSLENDPMYAESGRNKQLIIGVSANGADDVREEALTSGMNAFMPKPFSVKMLMEFLSSCSVKQI